MKLCITCGGQNSQMGDTCGCCNLREALGYHATSCNAKEEVKNMSKGSYEESKQEFFDKQIQREEI